MAFTGLLAMIWEFVPAHTYALYLREWRDQSEVFALRAVRSESDEKFSPPVGSVLDSRGKRGLIDICAQKKQPQYVSEMVLPHRNLGYYADSAANRYP